MKWLGDREILDCGYQEILVRSGFARELLSGGLRVVNEVPVDVWQVDAWPQWDLVQLRWTAVAGLPGESFDVVRERVAA